MAIQMEWLPGVLNAAERWEFLDPTDPGVQQILARWLVRSVEVETGLYSRNYVAFSLLATDLDLLLGLMKKLPCMAGVRLRSEGQKEIVFWAAYVWAERLIGFCASLRRPGDTALVPLSLSDYRALSETTRDEMRKASDYRWKLSRYASERVAP